MSETICSMIRALRASCIVVISGIITGNLAGCAGLGMAGLVKEMKVDNDEQAIVCLYVELDSLSTDSSATFHTIDFGAIENPEQLPEEFLISITCK